MRPELNRKTNGYDAVGGTVGALEGHASVKLGIYYYCAIVAVGKAVGQQLLQCTSSEMFSTL